MILKRALLGAAGWTWPAWADAFYPSDMPEEWRLTYYNTQYHTVFLAEADWRSAGEPVIASWAEDTHGEFVFLLEGASEPELPVALQGKAMGLRRDDPRLLWFDHETSLKLLSQRISAQGQEEPFFVLSSDGDIAQIERVRTLLDLLGF